MRGRTQAGGSRRILPPLRGAASALLLGALLAAPLRAAGPLTAASTPIGKLTIQGNHVLERKEILEQMVHSRGGWLRAGRYRPRWLDADLQMVLRRYADLGHLEACVETKEVVWSGDRGHVDIRIVIFEGEPTILEKIAFDGLPDLPGKNVPAALSLREGAPYNPGRLAHDRARIGSLLAEEGYAEAEVEAEDRREGTRASVVFRVAPGPRVRVGGIVVAGTEKTREKFVRRELLFREGDWYRKGKLLESRDRIYQTGLYSNVAITREPLEGVDSVPIRIDVTEKQTRSFGFGGGFGTADRFRLGVDWSSRNWLRTGTRLAVEAVLSDLYSDRPFEQKYELSLSEPWMFGTRTTGVWKVSHSRFNVENFILKESTGVERVVGRYRLNETATGFSLSREFSKRAKAWITYSLEWADADDPSEPVDPELLAPDVTRSLALSFERDARDHLLDPTRGTRTYANFEVAGGWLGGDNEFVKGLAGGAEYRSFLTRGVAAARLQIGSLRPVDGAEAVPDYKLFRPGGANSVRGYREEAIGPGNHSLLANAELRFRLFWRIGAVVFADGGGVWQSAGDVRGSDFRLHATEDEMRREDFRYGVGAGLRVYTPVGPVRADYGRKLKRMREATGDLEDPYVLHFSIGQAF
jgi:outer membrane protein insertion porin family